jgi:hypothetical protein
MLMKNRDLTSPGQEQQHAGVARPGGGAPSQSQPTDNPSDLIPMTALLRLLEEDDDELDDSGDKASLPRLTRMPEGIEVHEQRAGVAEGQWLLQVRCQCGRRWFEVEAIPAATCPRCGLLVYVNVAVPMSPA